MPSVFGRRRDVTAAFTAVRHPALTPSMVVDVAKSGGWWSSMRRRPIRNLVWAVSNFGQRPEHPAQRSARALLADQGDMTPTQTARHLREVAQWMEQAAETTAARARAIEAKYGEVFRTAYTISGEYYQPYLDYRAAPEKIATALRLRSRALALARTYDRRASRQARLGDRADLAVLHERGDTAGLLKALGQRSQDVRLRALWFLADLRHPDAVQPLIDLLDDPALTEQAARALGHIGDPRAVEPLMSLAQQTRGAADTAVIALGNIGDPRAIDVLLKRLADPADLTLNTVARALGKLGDPRAVEPMRAILSRLRATTPENDVGRRLQALFCKSIDDAIDEIVRANGPRAGNDAS
ncbi:HEAT repeat domain-containing protein [Micromonosporaceae bacterium B7E4]